MTKRINLRKDESFITLNILLKITGIISTGGMAKAYLIDHEVIVNNEHESRRGRKLYHGDVIKVESQEFIIE